MFASLDSFVVENRWLYNWFLKIIFTPWLVTLLSCKLYYVICHFLLCALTWSRLLCKVHHKNRSQYLCFDEFCCSLISTILPYSSWDTLVALGQVTYNALGKYPIMHHFVTEMCTHVHISVTKGCIVGYGTGALWDLVKKSWQTWVNSSCLSIEKRKYKKYKPN